MKLRLRVSSVRRLQRLSPLLAASLSFAIALGSWIFWYGPPAPISVQEHANLLAAKQEVDRVDATLTPRCWVHLETPLVAFRPGVLADARPVETALQTIFLRGEQPVWWATAVCGAAISLLVGWLLTVWFGAGWPIIATSSILAAWTAMSNWTISYRPPILVAAVLLAIALSWGKNWRSMWVRWIFAGLVVGLVGVVEWSGAQAWLTRAPKPSVRHASLAKARYQTGWKQWLPVAPLPAVAPKLGSPSWHRPAIVARAIRTGRRALILVRYHGRDDPNRVWISNQPVAKEASVVWTRSITPLVDRALCGCFPGREVFLLEAEDPAAVLKPWPELCDLSKPLKLTR